MKLNNLPKINMEQDRVLCRVTDELVSNGWREEAVIEFWHTPCSKDGRTAIELLGDDQLDIVIKAKDAALRQYERIRKEKESKLPN